MLGEHLKRYFPLHWHSKLKGISAFLLCGLTAQILFLLVLKRGGFQFDIPFAYAGDSLAVFSHVRALMDGDWTVFTGVKSTRLGLPGTFVMGDFPTPESLQYIIMKGISIFSGDVFWVVNIYYALTFSLSAMAMFWLLNSIRVKSFIAFAISMYFAFLPYHFTRFSHLFLASYFLVPFGCWILLKYSTNDLPFIGIDGRFKFDLTQSKNRITALFALSSAFWHPYYAFFFLVFLAIASTRLAVQEKRMASLISSGAVLVLVAVSTIAAIFPNLYWKLKEGPNPEVFGRIPHEAEVYGLRLGNFLLPQWNHPISLFRRITDKFLFGWSPVEGVNEGCGVLGSLAFLMLVLGFLVSKPRKEKLETYLGFLCTAGIIYGCAGGLGPIISIFKLSQIRCTNRVSVYLACFSFVGLAIYLEKIFSWLQDRSRILGVFIITFILGVGFLDISPHTFVASPDFKSSFTSDREFYTHLEAVLPDGASVLQLPYVNYPESPPVHSMDSVAHLTGHLHTKKLKWSFGAIRGRPTAKFLESLSQVPLDLDRILAAGFSAVYIDRRGYEDKGEEVIKQVSKWADRSVESSNRNQVVYILKTYNMRKSSRETAQF